MHSHNRSFGRGKPDRACLAPLPLDLPGLTWYSGNSFSQEILRWPRHNHVKVRPESRRTP